MNAHIHCFVPHHTTTQQEIIDIKDVFQSYYMKKYILIHLNTKLNTKLIVVGLFSAGWFGGIQLPIFLDLGFPLPRLKKYFFLFFILRTCTPQHSYGHIPNSNSSGECKCLRLMKQLPSKWPQNNFLIFITIEYLPIPR